MQYVDDKWYRYFRTVTSVLQIVIALTCFATWFVPALSPYKSALGTSWVTFSLAILHTVYSFVIFPKLYRENSFTATVGVFGIFTLSVLNLMHITGQLQSYFLILWALLLLVSGVLGGGGVVGCLFIVTIYFVLLQDSAFSENGSQLPELLAMLGSYVIGGISYLLWKPKFLDHESIQVKQLNDVLNNRQKQSEILLQSISDGVVATNSDVKIGVINPAAAALAGWTQTEANGLDVRSVFILQDEDGKELPTDEYPFSKVIQLKQPVTQVVTVGKRGDSDGETISLVTTPIIQPDSKEVVGTISVMRNISEKQGEEQRRADFISTASHEMRTPVAAIEGYLALALNAKISSIDIKARSYLEKAQTSTQRLGQLFQDLLTSAKAEDGRLTSHPQVLEMGEYLEQLSEDLKFSAQKKSLQTEFIIGTSGNIQNATEHGTIRPLYYITADPDRLREVITNIFDNAVKYTDSGKITLGLTGDARVVQIRISDTGPGIPADDVPHLFQKFYRVDNTSTRTTGGTGLGLFICRKIVELYNGQIWLESKVGEGSTFFVNFPRMDSNEATKVLSDQAKQPEALPAIA